MDRLIRTAWRAFWVGLGASAVLISQSVLAPGPAAAPADPVPEGCKLHGTAVHFVKSPVEAFKQAAKRDKLVFVLHLSGNIEDDGFT